MLQIINNVITNNSINYSIVDDKFFLTCADDKLELSSRIFVDNSWYDLAICEDACTRSFCGLEIRWFVEKMGNFFVLRAKLTNISSVPLKLGAFHLLEGTGLSETSANDVVLVDSCGGWFAGALRVNSTCPDYSEKWSDHYLAKEDIVWAREIHDTLGNGAHYSLSGMLSHYRSQAHPTWVFSFTTPMSRCTALPFMLVDPITGKIRKLALSNNFAGYELQPGESIESEEVLIGAFSLPHEAIEDWAETCAIRRNIKVRKQPPMGWLSWYGYRLDQTEDETLRVAELIKKEFSGIDFRYIQLDLGYNKENLPGNWFETNPQYPHGLDWLKKRLAENGFDLGIWISPIYVAKESDFAQEHPEALLKIHPDSSDKWFWAPFSKLYELDITHPEGEKFIRRIFHYFKSIGVKYYKLDFLASAGRLDEQFVVHDKKIIRGVEYYRRLQKIIWEELDDDDYVYWCSNLLHFGIGLGDTSMCCSDIGNTGLEQKGEIDGCIEGSKYFKRQVTSVMSRYYLHQRLLLLNPDSINIGPPAKIEECRLRATFVAMSGGQVFLGDRFDLAKKEYLEVVRQTTPPFGQSARPLDLFDRVYPETSPAVWHLHVDSLWDEREIVALVNLNNEEFLSVTLEQLGINSGQACNLWEFWTQEYLGETNSEFTIQVPHNSCRLVAVVPRRIHPWVLGTSFHYTQGGIDLKDVCWDGQNLSGFLTQPAKRSGDIILHVPRQYDCDLEYIAPEICRLRIEENFDNQWRVFFKCKRKL